MTNPSKATFPSRLEAKNLTPVYPTWLCCLFTLGFTWLVYDVYQRDQAQSGAWGCEMSWMNPSYLKIPWGNSPVPKYSLYLYREQGWDYDTKVSLLVEMDG